MNLEIQKLLNWFKKRIPNASCPMCQVPFFSKIIDTQGPNYLNVDLYSHRAGLQDVESIGNNRYQVQKGVHNYSCRLL